MSPKNADALAGLLSAAIASAAILLLAQMLGRPSLSETLAQAIASIIPLSVIEGMIHAFADSAKHLLFASVLLGQALLGALIGGRASGRGTSGAERIAALLIAATIVGLVGFPLVGAGVLGSASQGGASVTVQDLVVGSMVFTLVSQGLTRYLSPIGLFAEEDAAARRALLRNGLLVGAGLVAGVQAIRWLADRSNLEVDDATLSSEVVATRAGIQEAPTLDRALAAGIPGLSPEITPIDRFYVVSKNVFRDPEVDVTAWRLEVGGDVRRSLSLTYDQIKALPSQTEFLTLQCISNTIGGSLISTAEWRGVPLAFLLGQAGVQLGAVDVILRASDDYSESIPIAKAMEPGSMLAYEMNGQALPRAHGFPLRLIVPDLYGMKNVKWITKIEVVGYDYKGYWQQQGWSDIATMNTTSRIDFPRGRSILPPGPNYVGGVAVAGDRGIKQVEVSIDDGRSWAPAVLKAPLSPYTWVLWAFPWEVPPEPGASFRILVRATDGTGAVQTSVVRDEVPDGVTGLHSVVVRTASA